MTPATEPPPAARVANPVRLPCGLVLATGTVYPEFPVQAEPDASDAAERCVRETESLLLAVAGRAPGAVFDLDLAGERLPGAWQNVVFRVHRALERTRLESNFPAALRVTLRAPDERIRQAVEAGADIVNLETRVGLELFGRALRAGDVSGLILAAGVLAAPAVSDAWSRVQAELQGSTVAGGGDCARPFIRKIVECLRERQAPEVVCAIAVAVCAVRTLASFESAATGPARQGAWESLIVKAIRGCPVSLSRASPWEPRGAAMADLWNSGGTVEQTLAECRALRGGQGLRQPAGNNVGALSRILSADSMLSIAEAIQTCQQPYQRAIAAAYAAANILSEDSGPGDLPLSEADRRLSIKVAEDLFLLPESGQELLERLREKYGDSIHPGEICP